MRRTWMGPLTATLITFASAGCTHQYLATNTVRTISTVMDIQYESVLSNIALMSLHPEAFPNHVHLSDGVVQVNDEASVGMSGGFTTFGGTDFGIEQLGPAGSRQLTEQWGIDATTDPQRLIELQALYRVALGLPPLPEPNGLRHIRQKKEQERRQARKKAEKHEDDDKKDDDKKDDEGGEELGSPRRTLTRGQSPESGGGGGGATLDANGGSDDDNGSRDVPIEVLLTDVPPPGWYHLGCKKDVPKTACYVGRWGDRYAWVNADGVPALARFTVTALFIIRLDPGEGGSGGGLAVTR